MTPVLESQNIFAKSWAPKEDIEMIDAVVFMIFHTIHDHKSRRAQMPSHLMKAESISFCF